MNNPGLVTGAVFVGLCLWASGFMAACGDWEAASGYLAAAITPVVILKIRYWPRWALFPARMSRSRRG